MFLVAQDPKLEIGGGEGNKTCCHLLASEFGAIQPYAQMLQPSPKLFKLTSSSFTLLFDFDPTTTET